MASGALGLLAGACALYAGSALLACCLRLRSAVSFVLATNLFAWTLTVFFTLALSPLRLVDRASTWGWLGLVLVGCLVSWSAAGRPAPPLRALSSVVRIARGEPAIGILLSLVTLAYGYTAALAVGTPENEGDALTYHVARAAFWHQHQGVHYIASAVETRLNVSPPNGEIADLFTMVLSGRQTLVGLVQVGALAVCVTATIGLGRRLGFGRAPALFGGLLVATFPVVATQGWTALNDLDVAALLLTSAYFALGSGTRAHALAGLAAGVAIGTKLTAVLTLPLLLLVIAFVPTGRRLARAAWVLGLGAVTGSVWYLVNLAETGSFDGRLATTAAQRPASLATALGTLQRFGFNVLDLSGSPWGSWDWVARFSPGMFLYRGAGLALVLVGLVQFLRRRCGVAALVVAGVATAVVPTAIYATYHALYGAAAPAGRPLLPFPNTAAGATPSWFGPLGSLGLIAGIAVAVRAVRQETAPRAVVVWAVAPVLLALSLAATIVWDPWRGRFFVFAFCLAAASWGLMYRYRWLTWAVTAVACATLVLAVLNAESKPSGVGAFGNAAPSVWGQPDPATQAILRWGTDDYTVLLAASQRIPPTANLALAPAGNDFLSPYFGPHLRRHVELVLDGDAVPGAATWLIAAPDVRPDGCAADWRTVLRTPRGWLVARRVGRAPGCALGRLS